MHIPTGRAQPALESHERQLPTRNGSNLDRETNATLARVHQYVLPGGGLGAGGKPDPKFLRLGNVEYHLHPGGGASSDPGLDYPDGYARRAYVMWRRVKCLLIGR
jgi:hypothetical protein